VSGAAGCYILFIEMKIISVFGSSSPPAGSADYEEARELGTALARAGFAVCSGGYYGAMEAVSRGAREAGGYAIGLTTPFYRLQPNAYLNEQIEVPRWQDRLFALIEKGHGYVVLKGGTGTLLELSAVWECLNKRALAVRPCVAMEFWAPVLERVRLAEAERSRWQEFGEKLIRLAKTPAEAVEYLVQHATINNG
jgi:uncharacterized protein (TIGR00730 family)